jgi:hypothetical protein
MDFVPLSAAAANAYRRVTGSDAAPDAALLDAAAEALATFIPVFTGHPPRRLADEALRRARFRHGATLLRLAGGGTVTDLSVRSGDLEAALEQLARAGLRFSEVRSERAPRRLPTIVPA